MKKWGIVIIALPGIHKGEVCSAVEIYGPPLPYLLENQPVLFPDEVAVIECFVLISIDLYLRLPPLPTVGHRECAGQITATQLWQRAGNE